MDLLDTLLNEVENDDSATESQLSEVSRHSFWVDKSGGVAEKSVTGKPVSEMQDTAFETLDTKQKDQKILENTGKQSEDIGDDGGSSVSEWSSSITKESSVGSEKTKTQRRKKNNRENKIKNTMVVTSGQASILSEVSNLDQSIDMNKTKVRKKKSTEIFDGKTVANDHASTSASGFYEARSKIKDRSLSELSNCSVDSQISGKNVKKKKRTQNDQCLSDNSDSRHSISTGSKSSKMKNGKKKESQSEKDEISSDGHTGIVKDKVEITKSVKKLAFNDNIQELEEELNKKEFIMEEEDDTEVQGVEARGADTSNEDKLEDDGPIPLCVGLLFVMVEISVVLLYDILFYAPRKFRGSIYR